MKASLGTIARRALDELGLRDTAIVVATSGGPDSLALLDVLARLAPARGLRVRAHGVDHGLRAEAGAELDLAAALAAKLDVPFDRTRVRVPPGGNLQARARTARWQALAGAARRHAAIVATAHHADDRAETVLLRVFRGAGLRGLAVLPPRATALNAPDVTIVRPILRARRADILAHVDRQRIVYARDPSNEDARYLRTRVRRNLMPLLVMLDPQIVAHLGAIADEAGARKPHEMPESWAGRLPRATQDAIAALRRSGNREARVWLPEGLVVMLDQDRSRVSRRESAKSARLCSSSAPAASKETETKWEL